MQSKQFAEVSTETPDFNFCSVDTYALHKHLQEADFSTKALVKPRLYIVGVKRCSVGSTNPLALFNSITRHNVYSSWVNISLKVRMLSETFNLPRACCCFFCNFQISRSKSFSRHACWHLHKDVYVWFTAKPCVLCHWTFYSHLRVYSRRFSNHSNFFLQLLSHCKNLFSLPSAWSNPLQNRRTDVF